MNIFPSDYNDIVVLLKDKIRLARTKAVLAANAQLLEIYWEIGKVITQQEQIEGWGTKAIERLSVDLKTEFEDMKGFSSRNLRDTRDFYKTYPFPQIWQQAVAKSEFTENQDDVIWQQLVAKLPWGHHTVILLKAKTADERSFYIRKCVENNWSRSVLSLQSRANCMSEPETQSIILMLPLLLYRPIPLFPHSKIRTCLILWQWAKKCGNWNWKEHSPNT